jgi:8-oxo-dGTP diphosphatase
MSSHPVHIAVGVISNQNGEILIALRPKGIHQGGLWEFPGGKVETGETVLEALSRELQEELNITVESARPLIRIQHVYPEYPVLLDVWYTEAWHGQAQGREGQQIKWVAPKRLHEYEFPEANHSIIKTLHLPSEYLIAPDLHEYDKNFLNRAEKCLQAGVRLMQLRCPRLDKTRYRDLLQELRDLSRGYGACLLVNSRNQGVRLTDADGVHLSAIQLLQLDERPLDRNYLVAASCHNREEVEHACRLGLDFIVISPVLTTRSHTGAMALGWDGFRNLSEHSNIPVYALGGLSSADLSRAWQEGAQGVAMISSVWEASNPGDVVRGSVIPAKGNK